MKKKKKVEIYKKAAKKAASKRERKPIETVILFTVSVALMSFVLIPGENIWLSIHNFVFSIFGICSVAIPILIGIVAIWQAKNNMDKIRKTKLIVSSIGVVFLDSLVFILSFKYNNTVVDNWFKYIFDEFSNGKFNRTSGLLGAVFGAPLVWGCGVTGALIIAFLILFICIMFVTGATLMEFLGFFSKPAKALKNKIEVKATEIKMKKEAKRKEDENSKPISNYNSEIEEKSDDKSFSNENSIAKVTEKFISKIKSPSMNKEKEETKEKLPEPDFQSHTENSSSGDYQFPPVELLNKSVTPKENEITNELNNNGMILVDTLKSFNVQTKIVDISRGPAVTRYELQPAAGVKISKITTLADDIALNLAASGVRIEAPIPGKAAVGIEVPNKVVSVVNMRELIASEKFRSSKSKLTVVLGRDISGNIAITDLVKMPHLLIAGSTGSGKSVCINSFIISILYNARPDEVKLLMIDPKVVELGIYNGIPHLLVPVVTDARKAAGALNWAVNEMLKRYKKFAENNVRDLESYNDLIERNPYITDKEGEVLEKMPQVVIIIDELSDLMMAAPNEVEDYICRLAQMARAAGMHLVIATQRPSVDVITGIIKANIPSRIALAVSSQIDSRTILDMSGAEKLLGRGDMLFSPVGSPKPIRIQGCYVTDKEIENVIKFLKSSQEISYDSKIAEEIEKNAVADNSKSSDSKVSDGNMDPVMSEAIKCIIEAGQASTSLLQRRLRIGYARAGRLIDEMEQMGIVGPYEGSKPRQVLINYQQFLEMNMTKKD